MYGHGICYGMGWVWSGRVGALHVIVWIIPCLRALGTRNGFCLKSGQHLISFKIDFNLFWFIFTVLKPFKNSNVVNRLAFRPG